MSLSKSIESISNFNLIINNKSSKNIKEILMIHILNNYERIYTGQVYEEFFNLFGQMLINFDKDVKNEIVNINVQDLSIHILNKIYQLSHKYDDELSELELEQLTGNIYLFQCLCDNYDFKITAILDSFSQNNNLNIINFLYENLFGIDENSSQKFKYSNKYLRKKLYDFLINLIKIKEQYKKDLSEHLIQHHKSFKNQYINQFDLEIGYRGKNDTFIGLLNYGSTCYLNSLIQQLFMIPEFKNGIFSVPMIEKKDKFKELDSNPLYHLQIVFANLLYSIKQYHTPLHFIQSIKAFGNQPINVSVQQDCEEFLNILIDRIESVLKELDMEHVLDDSIRGRLSSEIISLDKEFPYYS